jgi:hypothetical protein
MLSWSGIFLMLISTAASARGGGVFHKQLIKRNIQKMKAAICCPTISYMYMSHYPFSIVLRWVLHSVASDSDDEVE